MVSLSRFLRPEASRRLLVDEGEFIVDEVSKHWVCYAVPTLMVVAAIGWSLFGTFLLAVVGVKLPGLEFKNQRVEAALLHLRDRLAANLFLLELREAGST